MAGNKLEKQIAAALKSSERWLRKQPAWANGNLQSVSGSVVSHRGPTILSEADCVFQFARQLNAAGVPWRDIHIEVSPAKWIVDSDKHRPWVGTRPPSIDLVIVDRDKLAKLKRPFAPGKKQDFLFDAIFEFKLASNHWERTLKSGKPAKPPASVATNVAADVKRVRGLLDGMIARRGYVVVVEECDHGWDRGSSKPVDGLSIHYLKTF